MLEKHTIEAIRNLIEDDFILIKIYDLEGRLFYHIVSMVDRYNLVIRDGNEILIWAQQTEFTDTTEDTLRWLEQEVVAG